jgi:hypothetical protein
MSRLFLPRDDSRIPALAQTNQAVHRLILATRRVAEKPAAGAVDRAPRLLTALS